MFTIPIGHTLCVTRLLAGTSMGRSRFSLRFCALSVLGLDQTNALRRSFPSGCVCEGDFLDYPKIDQLVQPAAEETTFRLGWVFEPLLDL